MSFKRHAMGVVLMSAVASSIAACGTQPAMRGVGMNANANLAAASVQGELVVRFKTEAGKQNLLQSLGLRTVQRVERIDALVVKAADTASALAKLKADPRVAYAEPNYIAKAYQAAQVPNLGFRADDELLPKLWGMTKIQAAEAWKTTTGNNVKVAVVDTGIDYKHSDFSGNRVEKGRDFVNNDDDAMDDQGHGTHCAGTIGAGMGNGGVVGVAPNVKLVAVKVLSASGSGSYAGVANGIVYAADSGAQIISMSLGGPGGGQVLTDAVNYAISKGCLVVAAMGNDNSERPSYPAVLPGVMAVGSTTSADVRSSFSNFGKHISVSAPGSDILSTVPGGSWKSFSGTSMATPHTAGLAALVKSAFPALNAAGIQAKIEASADDLGDAGFDKFFGHGRINAAKAVAAPAGRR